MPKILIADDNEEMLDTLERIFGLYNFNVIKALDGSEAVKSARDEKPDIIILDGMMPEMDGFDACRVLKNDERTKDIPVVFLTANYMELRDRIKGLELGADDYLLKPFNSKDLVFRIKSILKRTQETRELRQSNLEIVNQNSEVEKKLEELIARHQSEPIIVVDPTTGLYSRTFFQLRLNQELERFSRYGNALSLMCLSIENDEKLRENLGKILFSYLIIKIGNSILQQMRSIDLVSYDEENGFLILLPQTPREGAETKMDMLKEALRERSYLEEDVLKTLEFSRKKLSDITKLSFCFGLSSTEDSSVTRDGEAFVNEACLTAEKSNL